MNSKFHPLYGTMEFQRKFHLMRIPSTLEVLSIRGTELYFENNSEFDYLYRHPISELNSAFEYRLRYRREIDQALLISKSKNSESHELFALEVNSKDVAKLYLNSIGLINYKTIRKTRSIFFYNCEANIKIDQFSDGRFFVEIGTFIDDEDNVEEASKLIESVVPLLEYLGITEEHRTYAQLFEEGVS